jgi:hypothetical protein
MTIVEAVVKQIVVIAFAAISQCKQIRVIAVAAVRNFRWHICRRTGKDGITNLGRILHYSLLLFSRHNQAQNLHLVVM